MKHGVYMYRITKFVVIRHVFGSQIVKKILWRPIASPRNPLGELTAPPYHLAGGEVKGRGGERKGGGNE